MRTKTLCLSCGLLVLLSICLQRLEAATQSHASAQKQILQRLVTLEQKVPAQERRLFSGALGNWLAYAHSILDGPDQGDDDGSKPPLTLAGLQSGSQLLPPDTDSAAPSSVDEGTDSAQVSTKRFDVQFSRLTGFTQSTSSSAWCGHNVVTGFNSTTASVITSVLPFLRDPNLLGASNSDVGVASSSNDGRSFFDAGFLNPGPTSNTLTSMIGNPVVVCASAQRFFYLTSPFSTFINDPANFTGQLFAGVGLSVSVDGGAHWAAPVSIVTKNDAHLLDQAWIALDPRNPERLYVVYIDLDLEGIFAQTGTTPRCPKSIRHGLEVVSSANGGHSWSAPSIIQESCDPLDSNGFITAGPTQVGPRVAVAPDGNVLVSYMVYAPDGSVQLAFQRSRNHGNTFEGRVKVSQVTVTGDPDGAFAGVLQGFFANLQVPAMAVDPTSRDGSRYNIYIAWADGRDNPQIDVLTSSGSYNFSDILVTRSGDGGASWSAPAPVSPTPRDFAGIGRDQFQPGIAVNRDGMLAVCYYDRRNDPQNNAVDHYCSVSGNGGHSFRDIRQTDASWIPVHAADFFLNNLYLGQYDTVATHPPAENDARFFSGFQVIDQDSPSVHGGSFGHAE